ncbi:CTP synthase 1-like isoform X4 [Argiope bruennichi]|uniref:CTP synthase 1-like isoform X4 n=1 Tax=Argiope bruennichi TaxID=94029 RepID=UPI002494A556|nr:CTP synthase 1-like isoform X4 [Argiope bruennichi]
MVMSSFLKVCHPLKSFSRLLRRPRLLAKVKIPAMKYVLVTGGVISGIGKGVIASSIGKILKSNGYLVTAIKIDPYINIDAGTFSPYEHGEVFVLDDGGEVDLDLGNYERFMDIKLHRDNNITTGKIYQDVINRERRGDFLGKTVQVVPHITDAIQEWVERVALKPVSNGNQPEICIIELGGTIGDIEGMPFVEAFRQFQFRVKKENFCCVHVSLVPQPKATGEHKTKPTQASVRELRGLGLSPDLIVCRSENPVDENVKQKISNFCHVPPEQFIAAADLEPETERTNAIRYHEAWQNLCRADGVIVPGGFGTTGIEGKIAAIHWARINKKPFLGICLGFQLAVVEFARHELGWEDAHTIEIPQSNTRENRKNVVIEMLEHHTGIMGGTMRLGKKITMFRTEKKEESTLWRLYGKQDLIEERHRHRYEVDKIYVEDLEKGGLNFVAHDEKEERLEILELPDHPYFVAVQFHPEYISRPLKPSPPYLGLILAASNRLQSYLARGCQGVVDAETSDEEQIAEVNEY